VKELEDEGLTVLDDLVEPSVLLEATDEVVVGMKRGVEDPLCVLPGCEDDETELDEDGPKVDDEEKGSTVVVVSGVPSEVGYAVPFELTKD